MISKAEQLHAKKKKKKKQKKTCKIKKPQTDTEYKYL